MSEEVLKGFKLVKVEPDGNHELMSLTVYSLSPWVVKYIPQEWAYPVKGCGPISVFKTYKDAELFIDDFVWRIGTLEGSVMIWECEWVKSQHSTLFHPRYEEDEGWDRDDLVVFDPTGNSDECILTVHGVGFADKVKLLRDVSYRYTEEGNDH